MRKLFGRRSGGLYQLEWVNLLLTSDTLEDELQRIARDKFQPPAKRAAARQILRQNAQENMSTFMPVVRGEKPLEQLDNEGIDTESVKRIRPVAIGEGKIGYDIELHNRSDAAFDRIVNHTHGTPTQRSETKSEVTVSQGNGELSDAIQATIERFEKEDALERERLKALPEPPK